MLKDRITARIENNIHEISMILRELRLTNDVRVIFDVRRTNGKSIRRMIVEPKNSLILRLGKYNYDYFLFADTYINNSVHSPDGPIMEINLIAYSGAIVNHPWDRSTYITIETTNGVVCDGDMGYINDVLRNEIEPDMHRLYLAGLD